MSRAQHLRTAAESESLRRHVTRNHLDGMVRWKGRPSSVGPFLMRVLQIGEKTWAAIEMLEVKRGDHFQQKPGETLAQESSQELAIRAGLLALAEKEPVPTPPKPDPRLSHLHDDLRTVAEEFLSLHDAWGTEFVARLVMDDCLEIMWRQRDACSQETGSYATFSWYPRDGWSLFAREFGIGRRDRVEIHGVRIQSYWSDLRRSHDFAEFVQRFAVVDHTAKAKETDRC